MIDAILALAGALALAALAALAGHAVGYDKGKRFAHAQYFAGLRKGYSHGYRRGIRAANKAEEGEYR